MISFAITLIFRAIYLIILIVVLLSWIPIFDIRKEPLASLIKIYNAIMAPFKAVIPPIGMIDISPLIAFIILQVIEYILVYIILLPLGL